MEEGGEVVGASVRIGSRYVGICAEMPEDILPWARNCIARAQVTPAAIAPQPMSFRPPNGELQGIVDLADPPAGDGLQVWRSTTCASGIGDLLALSNDGGRVEPRVAPVTAF